MSGVRRIIPLTLGWADVAMGVSIHGDTSGQILREPVPGVLLLCDGGWLLLDTGFNPAVVNALALRRRFHSNPVERPILPGPGEPLEEALDAVGVDLADVHAVAVSHLHYDHAGGLKLFAGQVPVHVQRRELAYGLNNTTGPEENGIFRIDFDDPRLDWRQADGDAEIAPRVTDVLTAGHTPGHQSFIVDLDESVGGGGLVFAFDAADLTVNIEDELAVGGFIDVEPEVTVEAIRKLKGLAAQRGYRVVPGHDPVAWPALTQELATRWEGPRLRPGD